MGISILILSVVIIVLIAFLTYIIISERNELIRRSCELKDRFKKLSATDIQPQSDWPAWARYSYETHYKTYKDTFNWCTYRMQHLVASKLTMKVLEEKFYFLHQEQEALQHLLQSIQKYRKVPEMKIQLQERYEALRDQIEQLGKEYLFLHAQYEVISKRLHWITTDNQDKFPDMYRSLQNIQDDLDDLEKDLKESSKLKVA